LRTYHIRENNQLILKFRIKLNPHISTRLENNLPPDTAKKKGKGKAVPLQAWSGPEGSRKLRFPDYRMVVRLSVLRTGRLYPQ